MNDRNLDQLLDAWLDAGPSVAPSRVTEAARLEIRSTRQSAVPLGWLLRRFPTVNNTVRIALVSAAVVAVALIGISFFQAQNTGGPSLGESTPTPAPTPTPTPQALRDGDLEAGTYTISPFPSPNDAIQVTVTVPEGWVGAGPGLIPATGSTAPDGMGMSLLKVNGLYSDPCNENLAEPDIAVGSTVDDLVAALASQPTHEATAPTDVVVDGYAGVRMDLQLPSDIDFASCEGGQYWVWDAGPYAQGPGNRWRLWILDIDGFTAVVLTEDFEGTSAEDQAELQAIVDSIKIDVP